MRPPEETMIAIIILTSMSYYPPLYTGGVWLTNGPITDLSSQVCLSTLEAAGQSVIAFLALACYGSMSSAPLRHPPFLTTTVVGNIYGV